MNCLLVIAMNLIYTQNFPVRPETFGTTLVWWCCDISCEVLEYVVTIVNYMSKCESESVHVKPVISVAFVFQCLKFPVRNRLTKCSVMFDWNLKLWNNVTCMEKLCCIGCQVFIVCFTDCEVLRKRCSKLEKAKRLWVHWKFLGNYL